MKIKPHHLQQAGISVSLVTLILAVESKSAIFAFELYGLTFAAITLIGAMLAAAGFWLVGELKADERPHMRRNVKSVRLIAVAFLLFPVFFFGSATKLHNDQVAWDAYRASPAYTADVATATQATLPRAAQTADAWEIQDAGVRTVRPTNANLTPIDGEFWFALILLGLLNFAAEKFRVPVPITPEERMAIMFKERGRKSAETRKRRKEAKQKQNALKAVK